MGLDVAQKAAKRVMQEEPHRKPGGVGGEAQDIEVHAGVQLVRLIGHRLSGAEAFYHSTQVVFRVGGDGGAEGSPSKQGGVGRFRVSGPADHSGVSDAEHVVPVGQQVVQGSGIGEGGKFSGGSIQILFLAIGTECRGVEGYQSRAAGLGACHVFEGGMDIFDGAHLAGDKAEALGAVSGGVIISFPRLTDCGIAMDETFRCTENEISAGENTIQMLLEGRMFPCLFGFPGAKKCQDRLGRWRIHMLQQFLVKRLAGGETFQCSLGLALVVDP